MVGSAGPVVQLLPAGDAVTRVRGRLTGASGTAWVAVDGLGGSGKSTFADRLVAALPGSALVPVDDFARPGVPTWDHALFSDQVLQPLLSGRPARWRAWDWRAGTPGEWRTAGPGQVVVVEGVSVTDPAVPVPWDVRVWVQTPKHVRHARIRARDGDEVWRRRWLPDWIPSEERYLARHRPDLAADVVVDGTDPDLVSPARPAAADGPAPR